MNLYSRIFGDVFFVTYSVLQIQIDIARKIYFN